MTNRWLVAVLLGGLALASGSQAADSPVFKAGAATSNITPQLGGPVIGGFVPFPARHIHDELHARCLVLDDGQGRLALVVCDLLGMNRHVSDVARKLIQEQSGLAPERVLISATHTHSACSALGQDRFRFEQSLDDYQHFVAQRIADGVQRAINNLRPAEIGFGTVEVPEHVFNRRWSMRPGTVPPNPFGGADLVKMNPPPGSPNLVEPAGPTDPTVSFLVVREPNGRLLSVYTAYSLHYVGGVGDGHVSADYFGAYCQELQRRVEPQPQDPPFVGLLANGTSGDINNINFRQPRPRQDPYAQIHAVASDLADKVHAALATVKYQSHVPLDARYREPEIGWRRPSESELAWARKTLDANRTETAKTDLSVIYAERTLRMSEYPESSPIPVQVLRIGDVCMGSMPCEVFCEIGLEFRQRSPLQPAFLVSLAHGYYGYLPTPRQHALGGYETWLGTNRLEVTASDKLLSNLLEMAQEMK